MTESESRERIEISLADILHAVARRRSWVLAGLLAGLVAGAVIATLRPPLYRFSSAVEIGSYVRPKGVALVEQPSSLLIKIQQAFIPVVMDHGRYGNLRVDADIPPGGSLVTLASLGSKGQAQQVKSLQTSLVHMIEKSRGYFLDELKQNLKVSLRQQQNRARNLAEEEKAIAQKLRWTVETYQDELVYYKAYIKALEEKRDRVATSERLNLAEAKKLQQLIGVAQKERQSLLATVHHSDKMLLLLLIGNDLRYQRNTLLSLQERVAVKLPNSRVDLSQQIQQTGQKIVEAQRKISEAQQKAQRAQLQRAREEKLARAQIASIESQLQGVRETRALFVAMRSPKPVGPARLKFALLFGFLGAAVAALLALVRMGR